MARTLDQILTELNSNYEPQVAAFRQRQELIPGQIAQEEQGLQAKQGQAFDDILGGARRRGLGFSGIPIAEQARYTSTEFLPALARLKQSGREQALSLEDAILGIQERRGTLAQQLRQQELDRDEQIRQFNENIGLQRQQANRAAAGSGFSPTLGGGQSQTPAAARAVQSRPGSYSFFDAQNRPITVAQYAQSTGQPLGDLLYEMAQNGDAGASSAYQAFQNLRGPYSPTGKLKVLAKQFSHIFGGV